MVITDNVDATDFTPLIQGAGIAYIRPMLGTHFYDDLLGKYSAQTLSTDEQTLVRKMQYAIGWRATAEAGITLSYQLKNKGYQTQDGDNSTAVEPAVVWKLYDHYIQNALMFEKEIEKYLKDNKDLYPEFTSTDNTDSWLKDSICDNNGTTWNEGIGFTII